MRKLILKQMESTIDATQIKQTINPTEKEPI